MKVVVESNLYISNLFEPPFEAELPEGSTLRELVVRLNNGCKTLRFLEGENLGDDLKEVSLNGRSLFALPRGLDTPLKEGDRVRVEVYLDPLGGG